MCGTQSDLHTDVRALTELVLSLDNASATENLEADLIALTMLKEARSNLAIIERDLENTLAKAMPGKSLVVEGVGTFERHKRKSRTSWDKEDLLRAVLDTRQFDDDGTDASPLDKVLRVWNLGAPRLTALRDMHIDGDQFCTTEDTGYQIQLAN